MNLSGFDNWLDVYEMYAYEEALDFGIFSFLVH